MPLQGVGWQQRRAGGEVAVRAGERGGRLGAPSRAQVELGQAEPLGAVAGIRARAVVQVVHDVEQPFAAAGALAAAEQQAAHGEVRLRLARRRGSGRRPPAGPGRGGSGSAGLPRRCPAPRSEASPYDWSSASTRPCSRAGQRSAPAAAASHSATVARVARSKRLPMHAARRRTRRVGAPRRPIRSAIRSSDVVGQPEARMAGRSTRQRARLRGRSRDARPGGAPSETG